MTTADAHRMFNVERLRYVELSPRAATVRLHVVRKHFLPKPEARDFAWYEPDAHRICITRRLLAQPETTVMGVLRHELGHAVDARLNAPGAEARADRIARAATGEAIRYHNDVQDVARGKVGRPGHLPK